MFEKQAQNNKIYIFLISRANTFHFGGPKKI